MTVDKLTVKNVFYILPTVFTKCLIRNTKVNNILRLTVKFHLPFAVNIEPVYCVGHQKDLW